MKTRLFAPSLLGAAVFAALLLSPAAVRAGQPLSVQPGVYDPDHTGIVDAAWVAHQGLPDPNGNADHALYLQKFGLTTTNAAAGADVRGVGGLVPAPATPQNQGGCLGFDIRSDSQSSGGAPRFNVQATDGFHFVGGAGNGTTAGVLTDSRGMTWRRVRFDVYNPGQAFPPITPGATFVTVSLILDEGTDAGPGYAYLDNIEVNGTLIGKPGAAK